MGSCHRRQQHGRRARSCGLGCSKGMGHWRHGIEEEGVHQWLAVVAVPREALVEGGANAPRFRPLHPVCRPQPIQPSNGRFYSLQPPPPGPATPGGSLAARGRPQCRSGSRAPAHPCAGAAGARRKLLPTSDGWQGPSRGQATLPGRRPAGGQTGGFWGLRSQKTAVLPCDSLKVAGRTDAGL